MIAVAIAAIMGVYLLLGLPIVSVRTGQVLQSGRDRSLAIIALTSVLLTLFLLPMVHFARRNLRRNKGRSDTLICTACHEPLPLGTPSCTKCAGPLEPMDLWEWREPETRSNGGPPELVNLVEVVGRGWGFTGLVPQAVVDVNAFGNLLVEDANGQYWHVVPQDLSCEIVAASAQRLEELRRSAEFQQRWRMDELVALATSVLGPAGPGKSFCLKLPSVLGGSRDADNLGTVPLPELIAFSGHVANEIKDVPDGERVEIRIVD